MFEKKKKSCVKRIHLVTDDGLYARKAFYIVQIVFYSSSTNDSEFINYYKFSNFLEILKAPTLCSLHISNIRYDVLMISLTEFFALLIFRLLCLDNS